ncbi:polysaccharide deacetylase family protein [Sphingomonadaceae bacterium LXI357]|uniref:Polysaccharide deacetylase family protein n=1 Tax=Stakelama marina TaxID=2826939 RepID=A0A8T4IAE6_9SPHN|nr:polysaccharide deacetylase family protein [Stakelama marina]
MHWPADFGTRFTIFVDTEEEFDWRGPFSREARGTTAIAALPEAHRRLSEAGAAITYLVDHPVASEPRAQEILADLLDDGRTGIGTQLHPWVSPPHDEDVNTRNSFPGNLPRELEAAKLDILTDTIRSAFGRSPRIYRAGRYGIGPNTFTLLEARGYRIDSSMRARYSYAGQGGPDFSAVGNAAFRVGGLVELPLTTVYTGRLRRFAPGLYSALGHVPKGRGLFSRLGLLSRVALTPEDMPITDALEAVRVAVGEGTGLLNFSFHSPSVAPGFTPYVRDAADLREFYRWWDAVLALLAKLGVRSASEAELVEAIGQS